MKKKQLWHILLVTGFVWLGVAMRAIGAPVTSLEGKSKSVSRILHDSRSTRNLSRLSELERPLTSAQMLVQSSAPAIVPATEVVQVTAVKADPTDKGVKVILQTTLGNQLQVVNRSAGNIYIADIPNAQLRQPSGEAFVFRSQKPIAGIAEITVTNADAKTIRVTVTGEAGVPTVELFDSPEEGLIFGVASAAASLSQGQQPSTQPSPEPVIPGSGTQRNAPAAEGEEEIDILVTGEQEETGYSVPDASTATRTDTPLRDIPQSIQVIPRELIEDRQVVRFSELADNVSGVQPQSGYGGLSSAGYYIRGFDTGFESFRNGFRDFGFISPRDVANVERVEILKGPASVLYGGGSGFSGLINTVTKKPISEPLFNPNLTIGSYSFYRPTLDVGGPLTTNGSLLYRLNVAYENADSFRDFNENESVFVAPALTWEIGPRTKLTAEFEYQNYDYVFDRGLLPSEEFFDLPISRFLGEPGVNDAEFDSFSGTYNFEHEFSDNWKFRQGFNAISINGNEVSVTTSSFEAPFLEADGRTLPRGASRSNENSENYALQNEFTGKFNTGIIRHNVLFGVELSRYRFDYNFFDASIDSIDIFNPIYGAETGEFVTSSAEEYGADTIGIYVQDFLELLPNLKVLAGVRYDSSNTFYRDTLTETFDYEQSESEFSPRVGIVYQPSETTSLYASWSNSFTPEVFSRSRTDEPFQPTTGEQFEIGVKQGFFDNRLSATLALYQLTRQNVLTTDPEDPDFSIQTGEQKSRGVELDIAGEILPGWKVIATYAYTDAFVSEDNEIPENDRLQNVPNHSASLWTTYEIQSGDLQGLGFGAGVVFASDREVQLPNTIELSSYVRADAAIFYRRDNYRFAVNFKNISDTEYYNTQGFYITPAAPFTVLGTISVEL